MTDNRSAIEDMYRKLHNAMLAADERRRALGADPRLRGIDQHRHASAASIYPTINPQIFTIAGIALSLMAACSQYAGYPKGTWALLGAAWALIGVNWIATAIGFYRLRRRSFQ